VLTGISSSFLRCASEITLGVGLAAIAFGVPLLFSEINRMDILLGVIANFVTLAITVAAALIFYVFAGRRSLLRFFGIERSKSLRIFTGHIPGNSPQGLIGFEEAGEARNLEGLFRSVIPGLSSQPGLLQFVQLADIDVQVLPGRKGSSSLDESVISLKLRTTNHATELIEDALNSPVRWDRNAQGTISTADMELVPKGCDTKGVVVRLCHGNKAFFYVAGIREPATAGAARYLLRNWRSMRQKYGDKKSFYYVVELKGSSGDVVSLADHELRYS